MEFKICPKCGFENTEDLQACRRCGRSLAVEPIEYAQARSGGAQKPTGSRLSNSQWATLVIVLMMAAGSVMYRLVVIKQLEQTSVLFIGIPAVLAALVVIAGPTPRSAVGVMVKGITFCLLMSGILLGEGFICILMASPLFYGVGVIVAVIFDHLNKRSRRRTTLCLLLLPFLPLSLEGVNERLSFNRDESIEAERIVSTSMAEVENALGAVPQFKRPLPFYLRMGFPRPEAAAGAGLNPGDRRAIRFAGGEGKPGELALEVAEHTPGLVRFRALSDASHISHWLDWKEAEVTWTEVEPGKVRIRWTLRFTRRLDPAWYFAPWERYAARLAAGYLIETVATPD